jgi:hypothetical protein
MKHVLQTVTLYLAMFALAACTTLAPGTATPTISPTMTAADFNTVVATAERSVQLVQTSATALLRAGKINVAKDQLIQAQVLLVHNGLMMAKALQVNDPTAAATDLTAEVNQLAALKTQTGVTP